jgi:hypothetical protein
MDDSLAPRGLYPLGKGGLQEMPIAAAVDIPFLAVAQVDLFDAVSFQVRDFVTL